jgi:hypothetical protein
MSGLPSQERVIELLSYNQETGSFTNKMTGRRLCENSKGYAFIRVDGKSYLAHRLAWLIVTGKWPNEHIDHIDGNKLNNAFSNLREADFSQNGGNSRVRVNNKLGIKGVIAIRNSYRAQIKKNGKNYNLGLFNSPEKASAAYAVAAKLFFGQFARVA